MLAARAYGNDNKYRANVLRVFLRKFLFLSRQGIPSEHARRAVLSEILKKLKQSKYFCPNFLGPRNRAAIFFIFLR